ncbi:sensor histidine kinase [Microbispora sp. NPDC049125]|uniref:sensor histidine kinase n=1 Tax=Microbispora sp. NPDC049125 TaxID=3154929 RepID=UPI003466E3B2
MSWESACTARLWRLLPDVRPRSIRGRLTVLVTLLALLLLLPAGLAEGQVGRQAVADALWREDREEAALLAATLRGGHPAEPIVPRFAGVDLVEVVAPGHHVVETSRDAHGMPPLTSVWPAPGDPEEDVQTCAVTHVGCVRLSALRVQTAANSAVIYAGQAVAGLTPTQIFAELFGIENAILTVLAAWATWIITGRTLRPVEVIRTELASINVNDLSSRVPEPRGRDEIARLARTVNGTLSRIEEAKRRSDQALDRQRQFVADASHELRTPLAGLRAQLEESQLHPEETDLPALLDSALADADRLQAIMTDLLLLARVGCDQGGERTIVRLSELVPKEISRRDDRFPVHVRVEEDLTIMAVRSQIVRVLMNLIDNAQRHTRTTVEVEVRRAGAFAEVSVADDGAGISSADRERIFERFTRLDAARSRDRGGTGLGLAIAREIAHTHQGTLEVGESSSGGALFVLHIPLAPL